MRIGYYFSHINIEYGGIYQYALLVIKLLAETKEIDEFYIFYSDDQKEIISEYANNPKVKLVKFDKKGHIYHFQKKLSDFFINRYYITGRTKQKLLKLYNQFNPDIHFFNRFKLDVLQVPMQLSNVYHLNCKVITTMHDLQQMYFPQFFTPLERMYKSISYYMALEESDHVVVTYQHVKNDILKFYRLKEDKVSVCPISAASEWFYHQNYPSIDELQKKYKIPDNFILTPASTWEHKNHIRVLKALSILKDQGIEIFWVATGKKQPYYFDVLEPEITNLGLEKSVLFTDMVSDDDLIGLYKASKLVVIPTLYEAGSGPLFESWRYEIPVIASNATTIPEYMDNDEFIFDPYKPLEIAKLIKKGIYDDSYRERSIKNSKKRLEYYNSLNYNDAFVQLYKILIGENN